MMKMSELIARYGDDKIRFQNLDDCADTLNMGKKGTKITFGTEQRLNLKGTEQLGLVLWFDREALEKARQELKAVSQAPPAPNDDTIRRAYALNQEDIQTQPWVAQGLLIELAADLERLRTAVAEGGANRNPGPSTARPEGTSHSSLTGSQ